MRHVKEKPSRQEVLDTPLILQMALYDFQIFSQLLMALSSRDTDEKNLVNLAKTSKAMLAQVQRFLVENDKTNFSESYKVASIDLDFLGITSCLRVTKNTAGLRIFAYGGKTDPLKVFQINYGDIRTANDRKIESIIPGLVSTQSEEINVSIHYQAFQDEDKTRITDDFFIHAIPLSETEMLEISHGEHNYNFSLRNLITGDCTLLDSIGLAAERVLGKNIHEDIYITTQHMPYDQLGTVTPRALFSILVTSTSRNIYERVDYNPQTQKRFILGREAIGLFKEKKVWRTFANDYDISLLSQHSPRLFAMSDRTSISKHMSASGVLSFLQFAGDEHFGTSIPLLVGIGKRVESNEMLQHTVSASMLPAGCQNLIVHSTPNGRKLQCLFFPKPVITGPDTPSDSSPPLDQSRSRTADAGAAAAAEIPDTRDTSAVSRPK